MKLAQVARGAKAIYSHSQCSFEDVEGLVNNLILFATFSFAFSSTLVSGTWSHDDLVEADTRAAELFWSEEWLDKKDAEEKPFSVGFLQCGYVSMMLLLISVLIGLFMSISLGMSNARESEESLKRWLRFGQPLTLVGYILFFIGMQQFFFAAHLSCEMMYPRYSIPKGGISDTQPWKNYYDRDANEMIPMTPAEVGEAKDPGVYLSDWNVHLGLAWCWSQSYYNVMVFTMWSLFIFGIAGIIGFNAWEYFQEKRVPEAVAELAPKPSTDVEPLVGSSAAGSTAATAATEANTAAVRELLLEQRATNELLQRLLRKADDLTDKGVSSCI